jgi:RNA polymerase sigma factor (sigma-70 family)
MQTQTEDQEIITRFLQRETGAVRVIESWIARAASPFRQRLAGHWEDTLQEALLEVTRLFERGAFRGEASLKTYLWRVVNHACLKQLRAQAKTNHVDLDNLPELSGPAEDSPLQQLLSKEAGLILLRVLAEMPSECCGLWRMILDGLSYQQMSQQLGASEGALRVKVLRCRKRAVEMRQQLEKERVAASVTFPG